MRSPWSSRPRCASNPGKAHLGSGAESRRSQGRLSRLRNDAQPRYAVQRYHAWPPSRPAPCTDRRRDRNRPGTHRALRSHLEPGFRYGERRHRDALEKRPNRRSEKSPEDPKTHHILPGRSRIVAGENATVLPHRLRQNRFKGKATVTISCRSPPSSAAGRQRFFSTASRPAGGAHRSR